MLYIFHATRLHIQYCLPPCCTMFLLLLITALTCFGRSSWPYSGSLYVYQRFSLCVNLYGRDSTHQCPNRIEIKILKSLKLVYD